jgi:flagellin
MPFVSSGNYFYPVRKENKMANIGATTAFYKVETSLTRANNEVSKSMERLATGKQNANAGDRSSYVAMSDTFRLDYVGTKAGIKSASVAMGYLETGMRVIDSGSALLSRLQELAVLGANNTNTVQDNEAINLEAEAIADEFNRLMSASTYKGKNIFVDAAGDQEIAMGGRGQEMTFGIGSVSYSSLYNSTAAAAVGDPNSGESFNLATLPSDATTAKTFGGAASEPDANAADITLAADKKYVVRGVTSTSEVGLGTATDVSAADLGTAITGADVSINNSAGTALTSSDSLANANVISVTTATTVSQATAVGEGLTTGSETAMSGEALTLTLGAGTPDASRLGGVYTITADEIRTASGATAIQSNGGTTNVTADATFTVTVNDTTGATTVEIADSGAGWTAADAITIPASLMGGAGGTQAFSIATISDDANRVADVYTITADDYTTDSASGSGATFRISIQGDNSAVVEITDGGSGYLTTDTFTVQGAKFGAADASDLTFKFATVGNANGSAVTFAEVRTDANAFQSGESYVIQTLGSTNSTGDITQSDSDAQIIARAFTNEDGTAITGNLSVGQTITMATAGDTIGTTTVTQEHLDAANALIEGMTFTRPTETLTTQIEAVQALLNRARVEAGSQYAAMESAVSYTTDLTAQYELGFNTVNDVNFSAETAHLAKNQILQQAATAMLAQANSGQQGLLQLIQG